MCKRPLSGPFLSQGVHCRAVGRHTEAGQEIARRSSTGSGELYVRRLTAFAVGATTQRDAFGAVRSELPAFARV